MSFLFTISWQSAALIALAGVAGMLLDSVMGSRLQARFENAEGEVFEHKVDQTTLKGGIAWMDNDAVNLLSCLISAILAIVATTFTGS